MGTVTPKGVLAKPTAPRGQKPIDLANAAPVDYKGKNGAQIDHTWSGLDFPGVTPKYGSVVVRTDPSTGKVQVLLAKPKNYFGNTSWTWAKGTQDPGDDAQTTATNEAIQEVGAKGDIVGHLTGTYAENSKSGLNAYFIMRQTGSIDDNAWKANGETAEVRWMDLDMAHLLINDTAKHITDINGKKEPSFVNWQRDADVLEQAKEALIPGYKAKINRRVDVLGANNQADASKIRSIAIAVQDGLVPQAQGIADVQKLLQSIHPDDLKDIAGAMRAGSGSPQDFIAAIAKADPGQGTQAPSPPGPPPRPGLIWNPTTHRWILPPTTPSAPTTAAAAPAAGARTSTANITYPQTTPTPFVPKTSGVTKGDYEDLDYHVGQELGKLGLTAEQALNQGLDHRIRRDLQSAGITDYSVGDYEMKRTLRHLWGQQTKVPIPALFDYVMGAKRQKNSKLPNEARPKLTPDEITATQKWTSSAYIPWARALRETGKPPHQFAKEDADLQSAFAKAKVFSTPVAVERHLTLDSAGLQKFLADAQASLNSGTPLAYPGYQATSTDPVPSNFHGNVEMRINAVHGLDMGPHHHHPHVKELLLNHESEFKVTNIQQVGSRWIISYDQIPPAVAGKKAPRAKAAPPPPPKDFDTKDIWNSSTAVKDYLAGKVPMTTITGTSKSRFGSHRSSKEYTLLNAILEEAGRNNNPPQVLDQAGIDSLRDIKGWKIGFRGVSTAKYNKLFRTQPVYKEGGTGLRAYGQGTYFMHGNGESGDKGSAKGYGSSVMRFAIDPSLRVAKYRDLMNDQQAALTALKADERAGKISYAEYGLREKVLEDLGLFAALNNYDAIDTRSATSNYWVLLNRSKVAVQKDDV